MAFRPSTPTLSCTMPPLIKRAYYLLRWRETTRWISWLALSSLNTRLWWMTWLIWMQIFRWWSRIHLPTSIRVPLFKTCPWVTFLSRYFLPMISWKRRSPSKRKTASAQVILRRFYTYDCFNHCTDVNIAVFTSNCKAAGASARLEYLERLMQHIEVWVKLFSFFLFLILRFTRTAIASII